MEDARFTALGLSGSGKTCYVLGMYYEMCVGVRGFTISTQNSTSAKLDRWMDKIDDESGPDRFPAGTDTTTLEDYCFNLSSKGEYIMTFDWLDYAGRMLQEKEETSEVFNEIQNSIWQSAALYIFIDGEDLCCDEYEDKLRKVKRKARKIANYINNFDKDTGRGGLPPVVFVVTKSDLCGTYLQEGELEKIIHEVFSSVYEGNLTYITMVSLGRELADDDYSGEVAPINIQTPFFIGIYHEFLNRCIDLKYRILEADENNRSAISRMQSENAQIANRSAWSRFWNGDGESDRNWNNIQIAEAKKNIESNKALLSKYKRLMGTVMSELQKQHIKNGFYIIQKGRLVEDFETSPEVEKFLYD